MKAVHIVGVASLAVLLSATVVIFLVANNRAKALRSELNAKEQEFLDKPRCSLCHVKPHALNLFGNDVKRVRKPGTRMAFTLEDLRAVEDKDSDGDGWDNKSEFINGTLPGDPKSHPKGAPPESRPPRGGPH